jgi:hypothetical protein
MQRHRICRRYGQEDCDREGTSTPLICTVEYLGCVVHDFDIMSAEQRLAWLRNFQRRWVPDGWFNAIEEVMKFASDKGVFNKSHSWFSLVDAHILSAVQDGVRRERRLRPLVASNPGSREWGAFFRVYLDEHNPTGNQLRRLWGPAEQDSTDYGVSVARGRRATAEELTIKHITDVWRHEVGHPEDLESLRGPINTLEDWGCAIPFASIFCLRAGRAVLDSSEGFFDPRNRSQIRNLAGVMWDEIRISNWLFQDCGSHGVIC